MDCALTSDTGDAYNNSLTGCSRMTMVISVICTAVSVAVVLLRVWAKKCFKKARLGADDWWIIGCAVTFVSITATLGWGLVSTGGKFEQIEGVGALVEQADRNTSDVAEQEIDKLSRYLKALWISYFLSHACILMLKISVLCFYRQLFPTPHLQGLCGIIMIFSFTWYLVGIIPLVGVCVPVSSFWTPRVFSHQCGHIDFGLFTLSVNTLDVVLDMTILALPIRIIQSLNMPLNDRLLVIGLFLVASFGIVTGSLRAFYQYYGSSEYTIQVHKTYMYFEIHGATVMLSASLLPIYKPIKETVKKLWTWLRREKNWRSLASNNASSSPQGSGSSDFKLPGEGGGGPGRAQRQHWFDDLVLEPHNRGTQTTRVVGGRASHGEEFDNGGTGTALGVDLVEEAKKLTTQAVAEGGGGIARTTEIAITTSSRDQSAEKLPETVNH